MEILLQLTPHFDVQTILLPFVYKYEVGLDFYVIHTT